MGLSVLENIGIIVVHVLSSDWKSDVDQPSSLDGDMEVEDMTHANFVTTNSAEALNQ